MGSDILKIALTKLCTGNIEKITRSNLDSLMNMPAGVFIGSVKEEHISYKKCALLVKIREGLYVDLENIRSLRQKIKLNQLLKKSNMDPIKIDGQFVMGETRGANFSNTLAVNHETVEPIFSYDHDHKDLNWKRVKIMIRNRSIHR